jgi:hypothetical protein
MAVDRSHSGHESRARRFIAVHPVCGKSAEFQKRRAGINQRSDAVSNKHLAAGGMSLACLISAATLDDVLLLSELRDELEHCLTVGLDVCAGQCSSERSR